MLKGVILGLAVILAGCGLVDASEIPDLRLKVEGAEYAPGEEAGLVLINRSSRTFSVHPELCGAVLDTVRHFDEHEGALREERITLFTESFVVDSPASNVRIP